MLALGAVIALCAAGCGADAGARRTTGAQSPDGPRSARPAVANPSLPPSTAPPTTPAPSRAAARAGARRRRPPLVRAAVAPGPPFAVGLRVVTIIDQHRHVRYPGRARALRRLVTIVRYPAKGRPARVDAAGAPAARGAGPFPLVIFGHGFAVTPAIYARLLQAWARAGYVVAAPIFPLENGAAPGGPDETDLVNQPADMSLVISRLLTASTDRIGFLGGLIDPREIAVSGQSDGGETALAVAYDRFYRDRRVRAALILSGAKIPGVGGFDFPAPSPPLLATQGTADEVNPPALTHAFFDIAPSPRYLLTLFGASHLGPYTDAQPALGIVERVSVAFLDRYLKHAAGAGRRLIAAGRVPHTSLLRVDP